LLQDEERSKGYKFVVKKNLARWFIFLLIGICTALVACFVDISIEELSNLKYSWLKKCTLNNIFYKYIHTCSIYLYTLYLVECYNVFLICLTDVDNCVVQDCLWLPYIMWLMLNIIPVLIGAILVAYVEPVAAGSGIPQVKCYLNGIKIPRVVRIKTLIVKTIGVICTVVGGLAGGKVSRFI